MGISSLYAATEWQLQPHHWIFPYCAMVAGQRLASFISLVARAVIVRETPRDVVADIKMKSMTDVLIHVLAP